MKFSIQAFFLAHSLIYRFVAEKKFGQVVCVPLQLQNG
jgi:hypothetical protein